MPKNNFEPSSNFKYFNDIQWFLRSDLNQVTISSAKIDFDQDTSADNKTDVDNQFFLDALYDDDCYTSLSDIQKVKFNEFKKIMEEEKEEIFSKPLNLNDNSHVVILGRYSETEKKYYPIFSVPIKGDTIGDVIKALAETYLMKLQPYDHTTRDGPYESCISDGRNINNVIYERISNYFDGWKRQELIEEYESGNLTFGTLTGYNNQFAGVHDYDGKYMYVYRE